MKGVIKTILLLFFWAPLFAEHQSSAISQQPSANSYSVRHISNDKLSKYLSDKEFDYNQDYRTSLSLWDRIKEWINGFFYTHNRGISSKKTNFIDDLIIWVVILGGVAFLVYFLSKGDKGSLFTSSKDTQIAYGETVEDLHQMNFDELINDAISKTQYRTAVRYLYLKTLKELSDKGLIKWKPEKTNRDYSIELRPSTYGTLFSQITLLFDYSWYGNADINEGSFNEIRGSFEEFTNGLTGIQSSNT
jgi:hypothetical protein